MMIIEKIQVLLKRYWRIHDTPVPVKVNRQK